MAKLDPWNYAEKYKTEHSNQAALFMWANMAEKWGLLQANDPESYTLAGYARRNYYERGGPLVPQLKWLHAIHNQGHGDKIRGAQAKAEGLKAGVYDMFLPVPTCRLVQWHDGPVNTLYHGLYLELKVGDNKLSVIQSEFSFDMINAGYQCYVAWGWEQARDYILKYLSLAAMV